MRSALSEFSEWAWDSTGPLNLRMGILLLKKGDYQQAKTYFQKSLAEYEKTGSPRYFAPSFYYLVLTNSELELMEGAKECLHQLVKLGKTLKKE